MDIDPERIVKSPALVGALGALVAMRVTPGESWPIRVFNVTCGALIAAYGSPAMCEYFAITTPGMQNASAFLSGVFGMNFFATAVTLIKQLQLSDVLPWIRRKD